MTFYILLWAATLVIGAIALLMWQKTKSVSFPLGAFLLYFWSLQGAWQLVRDKSGRGEGAQFHYAYFEEKLFPINLDAYYFNALALYTLFVVVTLLAALWITKKVSEKASCPPDPIRVSHFTLILVASLALALSYGLVRQGITGAAASNISVYSETRTSLADSPLFTIHQLMNRITLLAIGLGIAIYMSGRNALRVVGSKGKLFPWIYILLGGCAVGFVALLGDRQELVFTGVTSALFYIANCPRPRFYLLSTALALSLVVIGVIGSIRGTPLDKIPDALRSLDLETIFISNATSNEQFAAHFSMYGAIKFNVPFTYGSSFVYLADSVVPRFLISERPKGIYDHYVEYVSAAPGQGYTIHHATAWYLNFGLPGVLIGAVLFGSIWAVSFNLFNKKHGSAGIFWRTVIHILPWSFVGYIPVLIRTGPEGYKAWALESVLLPTLVVVIAAIGQNADQRDSRMDAESVLRPNRPGFQPYR